MGDRWPLPECIDLEFLNTAAAAGLPYEAEIGTLVEAFQKTLTQAQRDALRTIEDKYTSLLAITQLSTAKCVSDKLALCRS